MEDRERMAAEAVAIYEELFETFKGRLSSDPKRTESRMHELMDATFEGVRDLNLPGVSTPDEVIVRSSTALAQLMADAVLQTIAVYLARHGSPARKRGRDLCLGCAAVERSSAA
jgi:hypothetical protein